MLRAGSARTLRHGIARTISMIPTSTAGPPDAPWMATTGSRTTVPVPEIPGIGPAWLAPAAIRWVPSSVRVSTLVPARPIADDGPARLNWD